MEPTEVKVIPKKESFLWELIKFTVIALAIVIPIRLFIAQPFVVSGTSMDSTFHDGEYLIVNQFSYHFSDPTRGQIVIFRNPKNESVFFIKRVIGLPGETVQISGTQVIIKNSNHPDGFVLKEPYLGSTSSGNMSITLEKDQYFVMGDNRRASSDSRSWGTLPRSDIVGTPLFRLFPINRLSLKPGDYKLPN